MSPPRRLPRFDAANFENLSYEEKLKLLNEFLEALDPAHAPDAASAAPQPRQARKST